jgi:hypothetical protein
VKIPVFQPVSLPKLRNLLARWPIVAELFPNGAQAKPRKMG